MVARRTGWCKEVHLSTSMVPPNPTVEEICLSSSIYRVKAADKPFKITVPLVQEPSSKRDARARFRAPKLEENRSEAIAAIPF